MTDLQAKQSWMKRRFVVTVTEFSKEDYGTRINLSLDRRLNWDEDGPYSCWLKETPLSHLRAGDVIAIP